MSGAKQRCVIVGSGHAAAQLCVSLTDAGWPGTITFIGDEPELPYHRPPLSKSYLTPQSTESLQSIRPDGFYKQHAIELLLGKRVESIDRERKQIRVGGELINYDVLVLATGSTHQRPPIEGINDQDVLTLQTAAQADLMRAKVQDGGSVVVIGAGFIGLEVAASLRKFGVQVIVLERMERVLSRVTSPAVSDFFAQLHRHHGVELYTNMSVTSVTRANGKLVVQSADGSQFNADFVVVGAGATPNDQLAKQAGLKLDNGIEVNEFNQTSDPSIYAIGDCCNQFHSLYQTRLRLESVQNANDQAKSAAASIMAGLHAAGNAASNAACNDASGNVIKPSTLPWFWSDQYDTKLQIAGISTGYDQCLIRGDAILDSADPKPSFSAWYLKQGRLIAVDSVNDSRAYAVAGKLIPAGLCPPPELIVDTSCTHKELLQQAQ
jgi:3-phenylpropionate/trans-cinnamate dioxygenase ferredoxin reductase component